MDRRTGGLTEMCIAFPGQVVAVDEFGALVETEGRRRRALTLFIPDIAVGDWVAVAAGNIVERLDADQAAAIQDLLRTAVQLEADEAFANSARPGSTADTPPATRPAT
jgi:hydrogenase assembly chaperone HypC/HupF